MPMPTLQGLSRQVFDVLYLVENQIVGVAEAGSVAISTEAARHVARDLGVTTSRNFWILFNAAARARVNALLQQVEDQRKK